jgi:hypothetical protein
VPTTQHRSLPRWRLPLIARRYGLAVISVSAAVLLMWGLERLSLHDTRATLLVAMVVSALYAGLGPGVLALALSSLVTQDPGVLVAGALLVSVCALFRRTLVLPTSAKSEKLVVPEDSILEQTGQPFRTPVSASAKPDRGGRSSPPFLELTNEATWRFHHEEPLDITLPEDDQVEHLYLYSVLAECNDAFARMYGFRSAADVIGTRLVVFLPPSNAENTAYLRRFIRSGYRLEDAESHEIDRYGNAKYFVNNLVGIFERGQLVGAWGTQRDVTEERLRGQENRSRIHSSKSSSQ